MKKIFYILVLITGIANAQIVNIPDANFKAKLLQASPTNQIAYGIGGYVKIDSNNDGEIQEAEALLIDSLNVSSSSIANISGLQSFSNLKRLRCNSNAISGNVDLNALNQLVYLQCNSNQITGLNVTALSNLKSIYAYSNLLTNIDLSQNNLIEQLSISSNNLTELTLDNLTQLKYLDCGANQIETLNCNNNPNLESIYIQSSVLKYLFIKNGVDESTTMDPGSWLELFCCSPNLEYVCCDDIQYENVVQQIVQFQLFNCQVNTYCSFTPGGNYNTINGQIQFDADNNGCDVNDGGQPNIRININDGINQGATFTDVNGGYEFFTQAGNHSITPIIENPSFFTFSPTTATITFADNNNNTATQNFCITANGVHPDLEIVIVPFVPARPGFEAIYKIVYLNKGNQVLSQQYGINFFYNQNLMVYTSSTVTPSSIGVGSTSWDYANLQPFESREILVRIAINAPTDANPVNIGDVLTFTSTIMPQNGDENTMDNLFILNQTVVGSYDPNDITCLEGDIVSPTQIGNYLHYNINFENTGTALAENVVVKIEVNPADFDINSLQLMNTSHPVDARIRGNVVEFIFQNILLDSGGHGNILLKIRSQSNLVQGDLVAKKANIYFDYNFPIETNEAETVFQALNNPSFEQDTTVKVYPNPASSMVTIKSNYNIKTIELYDVQGRLLQTDLINNSETTLDITSKSKGIYFLKIVSEKGIKVEKLVKE